MRNHFIVICGAQDAFSPCCSAVSDTTSLAAELMSKDLVHRIRFLPSFDVVCPTDVWWSSGHYTIFAVGGLHLNGTGKSCRRGAFEHIWTTTWDRVTAPVVSAKPHVSFGTFGILWHPLASFGILWHPLASFGILWHPLASFGILWHSFVLSLFGVLLSRLCD